MQTVNNQVISTRVFGKWEGRTEGQVILNYHEIAEIKKAQCLSAVHAPIMPTAI